MVILDILNEPNGFQSRQTSAKFHQSRDILPLRYFPRFALRIPSAHCRARYLFEFNGKKCARAQHLHKKTQQKARDFHNLLLLRENKAGDPHFLFAKQVKYMVKNNIQKNEKKLDVRSSFIFFLKLQIDYKNGATRHRQR